MMTNFREVQSEKQMWVWGIVMFVSALQFYIFIQQIILGNPVGNNPESDWLVWLLLIVVGIGLPIFTAITQLIIEVGDKHITVIYRPFTRRNILYTEIKSVQSRDYNPLGEYGGWGIRWAAGGKRAYNMKGNRGVELTLKDGKVIMLGSQQPDDLARAIRKKLA